ncbi:MAG: MurR/RpiR family transcriptional regulator [Thermotogae bacterium]|nr:MurR/RpiR family transcriptional regulator [Thermotogota bacterium]MCP5465775.1 MurR/RpiR family transcriptional regulator [Thermotogota bacterium]HOO73900.1 MurR/RpiR family transcriptional regulator [Tepiditoga sp.]
MVINKIKGIYKSLTKSEKKAADYIIQRPDDAIHYSITELGNWSGVSETTVYRLVKKIGYEGYQEFKIDLVKELSYPDAEISQDNDIFESYHKKISLIIDTINKNLDKNLIEEIADRIDKSRKIIILAVGRSYPVALDISLKLNSLGYSANAFSDPHMQVIVGANLTSEDTVIAVSHSGFIRDVFKSTEVAKNAGAYTIAITSGVRSPLSSVSEKVLYTVADSPNENEFKETRIGETFIFDLIYNLLLKKRNLEKHFENISKVIKPKKFDK